MCGIITTLRGVSDVAGSPAVTWRSDAVHRLSRDGLIARGFEDMRTIRSDAADELEVVFADLRGHLLAQPDAVRALALSHSVAVTPGAIFNDSESKTRFEPTNTSASGTRASPIWPTSAGVEVARSMASTGARCRSSL